MHNITRHHPDSTMFSRFTAGDLPMGMNIAVSAHIANCKTCQRRAAVSHEVQGSHWYAKSDSHQGQTENEFNDVELDDVLDNVLNEIDTASRAPEQGEQDSAAAESLTIELFGRKVQLPPSLAKLYQQGLSWEKIGNGIHRALFEVDQETKCELVYMDSGASVPRHYHHGSEAMLMLSGSICDDWDCYASSDFVLRGPADSHAQITEEGCVCLFVTDGALHFTEGKARLLNPINQLWFFWRRLRARFSR